MNIPGLEENAIMIDSVSKDTTCRPELGVLLRIKRCSNCDEICKRVWSPTFAQVAEAALDTPQSYFDEVFQNTENVEIPLSLN
jgi:aspartate aminotransferase